MQSKGLKDNELMQRVMAVGYIKAANAFSTLTGQEVSVLSTSVKLFTDYDYLHNKLKNQQDLVVLQTDIIGELRGRSYLILDHSEQEKIAVMSLKAFGSASQLGHATILKEIDNIVSAAVITELSNTLKINIYGDVPQLLMAKDITQLCQQLEQTYDEGFLITHNSFEFENDIRISPLFIWELDQKIVERLPMKNDDKK